MKNVRFIIVENEAPDLKTLIQRLTRFGVPKSNVWPDSPASVFSSWPEVGKKLEDLRRAGWDPAVETIVLLLDLALDSNDNDFQRGLEAFRKGADFYREYAVVLCTRAALQVKHLVSQHVDGLFDKSQYHDLADIQAWFERIVAEAIVSFERRSGRPYSLSTPQVADIKFDLAYATLEGAFSQHILVSLITAVCGSRELAEKPSLTVASGGYSGSFVLLIEFRQRQAGRRQIAVKLSRDRAVLQDEAERLRSVQRAAQKFDDLPVYLLNEVATVPGYSDVFYIQQHFSNGSTLERSLIDAPNIVVAKRIVHALRDSLSEMSRRGLADAVSCDMTTAVAFSQRQQLIFCSLLPLLRQGIKHLHAYESFKERFSKEDCRLERVCLAMSEWPGYCRRLGVTEVLGYEQHGDLNPRNILVTEDNPTKCAIRLIDFARFGVWPSCMDLIRLQAQVSLRLLDPPASMRELFPERMAIWDFAYWSHAAPTWLKRNQPSDVVPVSIYALAMAELEGVVVRTLSAESDEVQASLRRHLGLLRANELLRVVCYPDTSWPKKIWFTLLAEKTLAKESAV